MRSVGWAVIQYDLCPLKKGNLDVDMHTGRKPHENEGRDQGDASTNQGTSKVACKPPEATGEAWNRFSQPSERTNPANTSVLDSKPPEL